MANVTTLHWFRLENDGVNRNSEIGGAAIRKADDFLGNNKFSSVEEAEKALHDHLTTDERITLQRCIVVEE